MRRISGLLQFENIDKSSITNTNVCDSNDEHDISLAEKEQELPKEIEEKRRKGLLRTGFTTGTCACAATKSSLLFLITGKKNFETPITLPKGKTVHIKIAWIKKNSDGSVTASVIKDGGDDPDVTHGHEICSTVEIITSKNLEQKCSVIIDGGIGVGRVTKPGLGLEIGSAAINPVPKKMILQAVSEVLADNDEFIKKNIIKITISVPDGIELAKKTDNPRLGIINGISILGTSGIVYPFSTASFAASIRQSIDVSLALGTTTLILTTGGRSEDFARNLFGNLIPDHGYIQIGDFSGYSVKQCSIKNVKKVIIAGFIGKLTKMAMGIKQTHVRGSHVSMEFLADIASQCGASQPVIDQIREANTARHVSEIIQKNEIEGFFELICKNVYNHMNQHVGGNMEIEIILFDFDGAVKSRYPSK